MKIPQLVRIALYALVLVSPAFSIGCGSGGGNPGVEVPPDPNVAAPPKYKPPQPLTK